MSRSLPETFLAVATRHAAALAVKGPPGLRDGETKLTSWSSVAHFEFGLHQWQWKIAMVCRIIMFEQDESCKTEDPTITSQQPLTGSDLSEAVLDVVPKL